MNKNPSGGYGGIKNPNLGSIAVGTTGLTAKLYSSRYFDETRYGASVRNRDGSTTTIVGMPKRPSPAELGKIYDLAIQRGSVGMFDKVFDYLGYEKAYGHRVFSGAIDAKSMAGPLAAIVGAVIGAGAMHLSKRA